jgi:hypothetical protein
VAFAISLGTSNRIEHLDFRPRRRTLPRFMLEFAIFDGNDWFVVPLDLPVGSICRITSVIVTDTFGVRTMIPSITESARPARR